MSRLDNEQIYHLFPKGELSLNYPDIAGKLGLHMLESWCFCDPTFNNVCSLWLHRRIIWN